MQWSILHVEQIRLANRQKQDIFEIASFLREDGGRVTIPVRMANIRLGATWYVFGGWFSARSTSRAKVSHSEGDYFFAICSTGLLKTSRLFLLRLVLVDILLFEAQVCLSDRLPTLSLYGRMTSHEHLTMPWKSNHPAELDVCLCL